MKAYYLNTAAHLPLSDVAQNAYIDYQKSIAGSGNPSSRDKAGREAANQLEIARNKICKLLGANNSNQIILYSTCTEAINAGLNIFLKSIKNKNLFISPIEHESVRNYIKEKANNFKYLEINTTGEILDFKDNIDNFVICLNVHNETGVIYKTEQIKKANIFCDMSQGIGRVNIKLNSSKIDIACFSGHKFGGLIGFLYLREPEKWVPNDFGSRYGKDRAGTLDVASIVATSYALEETLKELSNKTKIHKAFQDILEEKILSEKLEINVICKDIERVSNITLLKIPQITTLIQQKLSDENIFVGTGSACSSFKSGKNLSLQAIGIDANRDDLLRLSWNNAYTIKDAEYISSRIIEAVRYYKNKI